jgi:hypothetical protein
VLAKNSAGDGPWSAARRSAPARYSAAQVNCTRMGDCSITLGTPLALGAYKWWVQAQNGGGNSPWSAVKNFTIQ